MNWLKALFILDVILVLVWLITLNVGVCLVAGLLFLIVIGYWIGSKMWAGEKGIWHVVKNTLNLDNTDNNGGKQANDMVLLKKYPDHRIYSWNDYSIIAGKKNFMEKTGNIPFSGILVTKEEEFGIFKRVDNIKIPESKIKEIASDCLSGKYDLIIAWEGDMEIACGGSEYIWRSYIFNYGGMVVRNNKFIRLFEHDCKGLTKSKMMGFLMENTNKNEIAFLVVMPTYGVFSLSEKVAEKMFKIPRDILVVSYFRDTLSYIYNMPFKIRSEEELIELAKEAERLHSEYGVVWNLPDKDISVLKAELASSMVSQWEGTGINSRINTDIISILPKGSHNSIVAPVKWRAWTKEEILKAAEEVLRKS